MQSIRDYRIAEKTHKRLKSTFYSAHITNQPETPVTIELIDAAHASPSEIARIKYEYEKIKTLDEKHIIHTYDVFEHKNFIAIVTEAFSGLPFYTKYPPAKIDIDVFLQLAVTLTRTLGYIHNQNIVHQSITPGAIFCDNDTDRIKIGGFGASGLITRIHDEIYNPLVIRDVLPYIAPEQTGRINCSVDHRADLYALGNIFYELLTGSVPFFSSDPIEIIHAHIALQPPAPAEIMPEVPEVVSNIVMQLLSKTVENRYQSAFGVMADFTECSRLFQKSGHIRTFDLRRRDIAQGLQIPEKLFGRETEIKVLIAEFERAAAGGNELLMVKGLPGIGKSSLINEIRKPVVSKRAYFICGKAEQYKRDIPYYPIIQAFEDLANKILCEPDDQIYRWKTDILAAVGSGGRLITDLIPEFEHIIGWQPDLAPLGTDATHLRINYIFNKFLKVCATKKHPMVIFVDDLQWADTASLSFIRMLSSEPEIQHLFIIGAYRDNEVNESHPLMHALELARKNSVKINAISLPPLSVENVKQMITGLLRSDDPSAVKLSEIIHLKTGGNPFFIRQFLKTLYEKNVLTLNPESGLTWDAEKIADIRVADNVIDLMAEKITALPVSTQEIIKVAACYGNRFHLSAVAAVHGIPIEKAVAELARAVDKGLIFYKADTGVFSHDRIREGVYQLFIREERIRTHHQIGRFLLHNTPEKQLDEDIIDIVNHLNIARELITSADEQTRTARLNLRAGEKAMASAAFDSAFHYFKTGIEFLASAAADKKPAASYWQTDYDLTLALYNNCAESAYLTTDYNEMHRLTEIIISRTRTINETVNARIIQLHTLMAQNKLNETIRSGLSVLKSLGVGLPYSPTKLHILAELIRTKIHISDKQPDDFLKLRRITDTTIQDQIDVMATITSTAYWTNPNLLPVIVFRLMRIFARHGNTDFSPYIYTGYGFILCTLGDIETGYKYGQMGLRLLDQLNAPKYKSRTVFVANTFVRHWKEHAKNVTGPLMEAYQNGLEYGDIEFSGHALMVYGFTRYLTSTPLDELNIEFQKNTKSIKQLGQISNLHVTRLYHQAILNLQGRNSKTDELIGEIYDETKMRHIHEEANDQTSLMHSYFNQLVLSTLFNNTEKAYHLTKKVMAHFDGGLGSVAHIFAFLYDSIAHLRYIEHADGFLKTKIMFRVARNQKKMKKWSDHAPENALHKYHLVEAEISRIKGRDKDAIALYKKAIKGARENNYIREAALACEYLAGFYLEHDIKDFAASYMAEACKLYERWGAHAKADHLKKKYGPLLTMVPEKQNAPVPSEALAVSPLQKSRDRLDISALIKMSQTISSEIQLNKLLVKLMRVIMENSGAEKAMLILNREDMLVIDAVANVNMEKIDILSSIPVEQSDDLCTGIINYTKRTGIPLVIDDAQKNNRFIRDPYIRKNLIRSVLCLPLFRQQRIIGLIYLENNLTPNVFTPERLEMITLLSTQTANCLENAIFFEATLAAEKMAQQQREQYQKLVETMNDGLTIVSPDLHVTYVNPALCRMSGYSADEIIGQPAINFLNDKNQQKLENEVVNWLDTDSHIFEIDWIAKNGSSLSTIVSPKPIYDGNGEFAGFLGIVTDVTDLKKAEKEKELAQAQLLHSQKLEAIGTLAGGVAHDFNNYLTTIIGSVDLINMRKNVPDNLKKYIANIKHAAELSAALTSQLLAFGRVQMLEMTAINLNDVVSNIEMMLRRLIGENIQLTTQLSPDLKLVTADFGQMEQIIMNLAVNARDAMHKGGNLFLRTTNASIGKADTHRIANAMPGEFVCLTVEDSGFGMDSKTVDKIFDPFFSSKEIGQGTGLGLSVVYGVVKQHKGWINVYSEPDQGTTFNIYLPVSQDAPPTAYADKNKKAEPEFGMYPGNQQRILLIEDQSEVREVVNIALAESGYIVHEATSIEEAENMIEQEGEQFELLFSDVILPDGNGIDFAGKIIRQNPSIKILLSSGYTEEKSRPDTIAQKQFHFLQKPYPLNTMLEMVHQILNE